MKKAAIPIILTAFWIGFSEFFRNQLLFVSHWEKHYADMGLTFPSKPLNGAVWMIWSLVFASVIYFLFKKLSKRETIAVAWVMGFVLMWLSIGNLGVLPLSLLWFAIPLSLLEVVIAVQIVATFKKSN